MTGRHFSQKCKPSKGQHFKDKKQNKISLSIILSVIALIEIILLMTSVTFSWFEGLTSLQMEGKNVPTAAPLKSEFIVGEGKNYESTAQLNQFFEAQANAKFTPVSSFDGEHFYALYEGSANSYANYLTGTTGKTLKFRELTEEEINSNILYFQFKVSSPDADTSFWFKSMPTFKINGTTTLSENSNPFRIRIDDGTGKTSSNEGNLILTSRTTWPTGYYSSAVNQSNMLALEGINTDGTGDLKDAADTLGNFAIDKVFSRTSTRNNNGEQVLFTVPKGQTKTITVAIWLEAFDQAYNENLIPPGATVDINMDFCSSWDVMDTITFRDYTAKQWVDSVNEDESNASQILGVVNLDSPTNYWYTGFKYNATTHQWTGEIPRAVQNIKFSWQTSGDTTQTEDAKWTVPTRGSRTTYTAFGSEGTGLWYDGDVVRIGFSDATTNRWISGNSAKMKASIKYSGYTFEYSMTDTAVVYEDLNTWYCFIPSDLDEVRFNRYEGTALKNYWIGPGRGTETYYYALESGIDVEEPEETGTTIYLNIPSAYASQFFEQNLLPAISKMSTQNKTNIVNLNGKYENLAQNGYVVSGAHQDTWLGDQGRMKKITNEIYSFHFDEELADGTYLTFWNKPQVGYNNLDNMTRMAPYIKYEKSSGNNMVTILNPKQLTNGSFIDAYIFTQHVWSTYDGEDDSSSGTTTTQPEYQTGRWGKPTKPNGTYTTFFVPPTGTTPTTVTATFVYENEEHLLFTYTETLTKNVDGTFSTNGIPDSVTSITFSDGTHTWNAGAGRTSTNKYFVCSSTTAGTWKSSAVIATKTIYLNANIWETADAWFWVHAWDSSNNQTDVKMTAVAGEDGLYSAQIPEDYTQVKFVRMDPDYTNISWDTGIWNKSVNETIPSDSDTFTVTAWGDDNGSTGTWYYTEPTDPPTEPEPEENVLYFMPNTNWKKDGARFAAYFFNDSTNKNTWVSMSGPDKDGYYSVTIPDGTWPKVIFCRMNGSTTTNNWNNKWNQTGDLTIPTDGKNLFTLSSSAAWDGATTTWSKK